MSSDDESPIPSILAKRQLLSGKRTLNNPKKLFGHESSLLEDMQSISEEDNDVVEEQEKTKGRSEKRLSGSFSSNLGGINEEEESEELEEQREQIHSLPDISKNVSNRKPRTLVQELLAFSHQYNLEELCNN